MTKDLTLAERELIENSINFISSLTVKNPYMANINETTESARNARCYKYVLENDTYEFLFFDYTEADYIAVGITDPELIEVFVLDKSLVPESYRGFLLNNKVDYYKNNYEEMNNYYRMLNGLPDYGVSSSEYIMTSLGVYVHLLNEEQFYILKNSGEIDEIMKNNPTRQYIRYVDPTMKIDPYTARCTKDFYIIKYNSDILEDVYGKQIIDYYYEIMIYTMSVLYSNAYVNQEYYDSYMIIYMLTATLQKFFANNITNVMRRDVFDMDSIRNFFYSYGLPFYEDIPLQYQRKVLKNINHLLSYKGTDRVLIDLTDIFGFKDTELYKYYLIKDNKKDLNGNPIITGDPVNDYILKFAQVPLGNKDVSSYLRTDFLYQDYEDVVEDDPYWGQNDDGEIDEELVNEIKKQDFNYVATKYLSVNTIFNMSECFFETTYFFNLMERWKKEGKMEDLLLFDSEIKPTDNIRLFDLITALYILLFRRFGYSNNINYKPTDIACIYGFNFDETTSMMKDFLSNIEDDNSSLQSLLGEKMIDSLFNIDIDSVSEIMSLIGSDEFYYLISVYSIFKTKNFEQILNLIVTDEYQSMNTNNYVFMYFRKNAKLAYLYDWLISTISGQTEERIRDMYNLEKDKFDTYFNNMNYELYSELKLFYGKLMIDYCKDETTDTDRLLELFSLDKNFTSGIRLETLKNLMHDKSKITIDGKDLYYHSTDEIEELIKILELPNTSTKEDILNTYFTDRDFNTKIETMLNNTDDIRVFKALESLKSYNMYSQAITDLYGEDKSISDITTYEDYLQETDIQLYDWVNAKSLDYEGKIDKEGTIKAIDTVLEGMDLYFNSDKFLHLFTKTNVTLDLVRTYLMKMISIFKAYTVDIKKVNIYYIFDDRYLNTIRLFNYYSVNVSETLADSIEKNLADDIEKKVNMYFKEEDYLGLTTFIDDIESLVKFYYQDEFNVRDKITSLVSEFRYAELNDIIDMFAGVFLKYSMKTNMPEIEDDIHYIANRNDKDEYDLSDKQYFLDDHILSADLNDILDEISKVKNKTLIDSNKIINGKEDISITYSYINNN